MIWSNWQRAIGRGAALAVLFWAGLAWTQGPSEKLDFDGSERIMVVHEGGRSTRCRVLETWQLPDKRVAHLLQGVESSEYITIVDDKSPSAAPGGKSTTRSIRIFAWGPGRRTPPEGSPMPPRRPSDGGLEIKNGAPAGPLVFNRDEAPDSLVFPDKSAGVKPSALTFPGTAPKQEVRRADAQVMSFQGQPTNAGPHLPASYYSGQVVTSKPCDTCGPSAPKRPPVFPRFYDMIGRVKPRSSGPAIVQSHPHEMLASNPLPIHERSGPIEIGPAMPPVAIMPEPAPVRPIEMGKVNPSVEISQPLPSSIPVELPPGVTMPGSNSSVGPKKKGPFGNLFGSKTNPPAATVPSPSLPPQSLPLQEVGKLPIGPSKSAPAPLEIGKSPSIPVPPVKPVEVPPSKWTPLPAPVEMGKTPSIPAPVRPMDVPATTLPPIAPPTQWEIAKVPTNPVMPPVKPPVAPPMVGMESLPLGRGSDDVPRVPAVETVPPTPMSPHSPTAPVKPPIVASNDVKPSVPGVTPPAPKDSPDAKKTWRPGDRLQTWFKPGSNTKPEPKTPDAVAKALAKGPETARTDNLLDSQNKIAQKQIEQRVEQIYKVPFSTAMSTTPLPNTPRPEPKKPEPTPLAMGDQKPVIPPPSGNVVPPPGDPTKMIEAPQELRDMWGKDPTKPVLPPGRATLDQAIQPKELVKLPAPVERPADPLMHPDRLTPISAKTPPVPVGPPAGFPGSEKTLPKPEELKTAPPFTEPSWPLNSQSVLAARSGLQGPVAYVPVPIMTVPQPHAPPTPPEPKMPTPPQLNYYVNAFTPPPMPKGIQQYPTQGQMPSHFDNQMAMQQMMMQQQQMMLAQQQMLAHQHMMAQQNPMMPYMTPMNPMAQGTPYRAPMPSSGPMNNFSRHYTGPMPPNPTMQASYGQPSYGQMPYPPMQPTYGMMPQQPMQPVHYAQPAPGQQIDQLLRVLRESPYPAQREWAAQSLASFDWRANPQVVPALLQAAMQDPAANVRASAVSCLGRIGAAVEPVFGALQSLRNDIDPRVRQEVEQAFMRLGQMPMMPQ